MTQQMATFSFSPNQITWVLSQVRGISLDGFRYVHDLDDSGRALDSGTLYVPSEHAALIGSINPTINPKPRLLTFAAERRKRVISGGCVVAVGSRDIPTWSDPDTVSALTALVMAAQIDPTMTTTWKGRDGVFYPLNATEVAALARGVMVFVQSAFNCEATVSAGVVANTITSVEQVDAAVWPSND